MENLSASSSNNPTPMVAARSKDAAFIVSLTGLGETGENVLYTQAVLLMKADGVSPEVITQTNALLKSIFTILKAEPDNKIAESRISETVAKQSSEMNEAQRKAFAPVKTKIESQIIPIYLTAWFRYFIAYDPRPTLERVRVPVLALNRENDLHAASRVNLELIAAGLKAGGNKDVTTIFFPKLNHLFQTNKTGRLTEYGEIEETISPTVLETISNWILKRTIASKNKRRKPE
ncbi:MAG: hypothetical protein M3367_08805 [Acidobacteriota bacterium]|nr:hypothetical protein [Acidobacteriota bacterium]